MSKGQIQLIRQILGAGGDASDLPLAQIRRNFDLLLGRFPGVEDLDCRPVEIPGLAKGARAEWIDAREHRSETAERTILYFHGGGFVLGSLDSHRHLIARLSRAAGARCLALEYRKAPEHPYPAAKDDALVAYGHLLEIGINPTATAMAGDSAGACLAVMSSVRLQELDETLPGALVCLSPWTDFEGIGDSLTRHADLDPVVTRSGLEKMAAFYLAGQDPKDPRICPLTANLSGLPPMLIQAGGSEALLDDATRLHDRALAAGLRSELEIWPDMIHVWQLFAGRLEEGRQALDAAGQWLQRALPDSEGAGPI